MQYTIQLKNNPVNFTLKQSKRQSLGLKIKNGTLEVTAPKGIPYHTIEQALQYKAQWILSRLGESIPQAQLQLSEGASLWIAGKTYTLIWHSTVKISHDTLFLPKTGSKMALKRLIYQHGAELITPKVQAWAEIVGKSPTHIKVSRAKARYGSMASSGVLNISLGTFLLPETVLDYVLVHELCHLWHMNHSAAFWQKVHSVLPHYQEQHTALKQYGTLLEELVV